ncbi:MAG: c-type cytochrome [Bacteroidia bacterium]|nr:c-type cytochrome [Bacteroidia bacterium]
MLHYAYRHLTSKLLVLFLIVIFQTPLVAQPDGAALFKANCTACHVTGEDVVVGPGLKNVHLKYKEDWLIKWIKNSQAMVKAGDAQAVKVYEQFNKVAMPAFSLSDDEVKAVIAYIKAESEAAPAAPAAGAAGAPAADAGAAAGSDNFPLILLLVTILLIALFLILNRVQKGLQRIVDQRNGVPEPVILRGKAGVKHWIREHKKLIALLLIVGFVWGSVEGWNALAGIGIQQGYAPDQPIKFSHQLHVGQNKIDCRYCHSGAEKSKNAGIPSPNVCMNCHKYVKKGPQYGTTEIAKIYEAIGWDVDKQAYTGKTKPIEWVRIHNLPDLAYFNHAQHVKVGGVECQTCHGPVETMETMSQFSPLTMGWCIQCHRDSQVKTENNGYYTELHEKMKKQYGPDVKLTVEKLGGTECARCHY